MPIVDLNIEYEIPADIKKLITDDFLKEFVVQLTRIYGWSIDSFADDSIVYVGGTGGWYAAFGKACIETKNRKLFDYYIKLEWYDSDIFDSEIIDILIKKKIILGYKTDVLNRELGIDFDDCELCSCCGKLVRKEMLILDDEEYICMYCHDKMNSKDTENNTTDYYRETSEEVDEWRNECH